MVPTIDNRKQRGDRPSVHALIVGVSDYGPYLPSEAESASSKGAPTYGMRSLTTPAASAAAVFNWLVCNQDNLRRPLGTCRLLLAPSAGEQRKLNLAPEYKWSAATRASFTEAADEWRDDASERPGHVTLFYFAGHGVQLDFNRQVLLFPGFGNPKQAPLRDGVLRDEILVGMGPSDDRKKVAKTQIYFIDACRNEIEDFDKLDSNTVTPLWKALKLNGDYRDVAVFPATAHGSQAYSIPEDMTVFSRALIDCLSGLAGTDDVKDEYDSMTQEPIWWVTANSLSQALIHRVPSVSETYKLPRQEVHPFGQLSNVPIVRLGKPPSFPVCVRLVPSGAEKKANIEVSDDDGNRILQYTQPFEKHPIWTELPGGIYRVNAFGDSPPLDPRAKRSRISKSPFSEWRIQFLLNSPGKGSSDPNASEALAPAVRVLS